MSFYPDEFEKKKKENPIPPDEETPPENLISPEEVAEIDAMLAEIAELFNMHSPNDKPKKKS